MFKIPIIGRSYFSLYAVDWKQAIYIRR